MPVRGMDWARRSRTTEPFPLLRCQTARRDRSWVPGEVEMILGVVCVFVIVLDD